MLGGNYVNRFSIQGRSYKVIPQVKRVERLTPDQLSQIYVKGSADKLVPLSTFVAETDRHLADLRASKRLDLSELDWAYIPNHPLSDGDVMSMHYMIDIETHTVIYLHLSRRHLRAVANPLDTMPVSAPDTARHSRRLQKR